MPDAREIATKLQAIGQEHLLRFYDQLDPAQQRGLIEQIASFPLDEIPEMVETYVRNKPQTELPADLAPASYYPADTTPGPALWNPEKFRATGEELLKAGKVAAFVVAGGQGSRLGFDGPKGCYPATPITHKPLFRLFAEQIRAAMTRYGKKIPWYIMTSPLNHAATVAFFEEHNYFGLSREDVMFFPQGVMPSFDMQTGRILLSERHEVATNPDGHGGCVRALHRSGALADMEKRGIEHLSYFQVDNPHVHIIDPLFLGLHAAAPDSSGEMSSKMVAKSSPTEKVGVFCQSGGRTFVMEYSDLPERMQHATGPDGQLKFIAGSIAIHMIGVAFLRRLATDKAFSLPWHRAEKKIPHTDINTGQPVNPQTTNGVKLERFVFDALPLCKASIVLETDRVEEFAPIKNATGVDSVESSRALQTERAARWLEAAGVSVPRKADGTPDCVIEISPKTAMSAADLQKLETKPKIAAGGKVQL